MDTPRSEQGYTPGHDSVRSDVGRVTVGEGERAVDVDGLQLTYADGTETVRGVDLVVPEGEFFAFLSPNGAGKTTTIKDINVGPSRFSLIHASVTDSVVTTTL
jgi:ABC-2 type transport system ATP-binding protein